MLTILGRIDPADLPASRRQVKAEREYQKREHVIVVAQKAIKAEQSEIEKNLDRLKAHAAKLGWNVRRATVQERRRDFEAKVNHFFKILA